MRSNYLEHTQNCRILICVDFGRRQIVHHFVYEHYNIYTSARLPTDLFQEYGCPKGVGSVMGRRWQRGWLSASNVNSLMNIHKT